MRTSPGSALAPVAHAPGSSRDPGHFYCWRWLFPRLPNPSFVVRRRPRASLLSTTPSARLKEKLVDAELRIHNEKQSAFQPQRRVTP